MRYLLDTSVLRELGRTDPHQHVDAWKATVDDADLFLSVLTVREVVKGVEKLRIKKSDVAADLEAKVNTIFAAFSDRIMPVDEAVARLWGRFIATSEKHVTDYGIAATALVHDLIVVTRNTKDFRNLGVRLLNPFKSPPENLS